MISKLPSYGFYPSLYNFIPSFLSDSFIPFPEDDDGFSPKSPNIVVPQGFLLSSTLFLLFINDLRNHTACPIHSYADETTLHFSMSFQRQPIFHGVDSLRRDAAERLTSDLSKISN